MATAIAVQSGRKKVLAMPANAAHRRPHEATSRRSVTSAFMWIAPRHRATLENRGLAQFDAVMTTTAGRCLRVLEDRENWYLQGSRHTPCDARPAVPVASSFRSLGLLADGTGTVPATLADGTGTVPATLGMYLKKHRARTWRSRIAAALGAGFQASPGRVEGENTLALQSLGIGVMPLMAYGERLHVDGRLESFLLTEELHGYCELQDFIQRRFPAPVRNALRGVPYYASSRNATSRNATEGVPYSSRLDPMLRGLIVQVADIARRFHAAGFNHRDFYCCHFLVKEIAPGRCDVRLIDLQRVQKRRWFRRRWIVKDLAQLASMSPDDRIGCRDKILFLRTYLGVRKLRPQDKRLVREVFRKLALIRRHARTAP